MADIQRDFDTPEGYDQPTELCPSAESVKIVDEFDDAPDEETLRGVAHFDLGRYNEGQVIVQLSTVRRDNKLMAQKAVDALLNAGFRYTGRST